MSDSSNPYSSPPPAGKPGVPLDAGRWYHELTRYHWFVLLVAALGWMFDCLDQQLFLMARVPAMNELLATSAGERPSPEVVQKYSGWVTSIFLIGWATGGLAFGVLGDRIGRAKTMVITILMYSLFTGLSALSTTFWDFAAYRFLTGLGVGGEFAVGVSLVAEVMPNRARPFALGLLQALSAFGNVSAALVNMGIGQMAAGGSLDPASAWRWMFVVGAVPALLAIIIRRRLKEPERWKAAISAEGPVKKAGSYAELFGDPVLRKRALVGLGLASSGVIGLWGIGFFSFDLIRSIMRSRFEAEGLSPAEVEGKLTYWVGITSILQNVGAFFGIYSFSIITARVGRRPAFAVSFIAAMASTILVFWKLDSFTDIFWMIPLMGFFQLAIFGGYAIYFPELFPTRLRSTGTSFCYNVGRYVAAVGPALLGWLASDVYGGYDQPLRYAGVTMSAVFLIGLAVLPFAPETKGQMLPD